MNRRTISRFSLLSLLIILAGACAKISMPTGGPRDRTPPVVLKTIPEYGAKNFRGKGITVTFDEYVKLDNINEKFMVSPPMKKKPRILIKGKSVVVEFAEGLRDSTTYTLYFQDAIRDLNEGNILENYQFVFSTGPVLDSLSVTGNVYNAFNLDVPEKTMVLLYRNLEDSAVRKLLPDYISLVDSKGYFRINNVSGGKYRLYALTDADNSKNYDNTDEPFAFMNSPVDITSEKNFIPVVKDTTVKKNEVPKISKSGKLPEVKAQDTIVIIGEYQLMLFEAQRKSRYLTSSSRPLMYEMIYTLSRPPDSLKFSFSIRGRGDEGYYIEENRDKDTIRVWMTDSTLYSKSQIETIVNYPYTDSLGKVGPRQDTIMMRFLAPRIRGTKIKKPAFKFETSIKNATLKPGEQIVLTSGTPFSKPDTSRIELLQLSDSGKVKMPYRLVRDSSNSCRYLMFASLPEGKKYTFIARKGSFGNIYNETSDSTGINFSVKTAESYGKLTIDVHDYTGDRIIQLLISPEKLISESEMKSDGKVVFPLLDAGLYRLKVIYDLNGDGKWTTGDFSLRRQPEPVSYFPKEINLKTGWESTESWDISKEYVKPEKMREKKTSRR
jgi:Bacterial Ig-like domain